MHKLNSPPYVATALVFESVYERYFYAFFLVFLSTWVHPACNVQADDFDGFDINRFAIGESYDILGPHSTGKTNKLSLSINVLLYWQKR